MKTLMEFEIELTKDLLDSVAATLASDDPYKYARATGMLSARLEGMLMAAEIVERSRAGTL